MPSLRRDTEQRGRHLRAPPRRRAALSCPSSAILCIPARDEAQRLPRLLAALARLAAGPGGLTICVYLDGCTDDSETLLRAAMPGFPHPLRLRIGERHHDANAGRARRSAMAMGLDLLADRAGLLFTTDADSAPAPDWILAGTAALAIADVVAGRIVRRNGAADRAQSRVEAYYDRLHGHRRRIDPVPWEARAAHHFGGGANLALRASVYRALGGFRPLPVAEDALLLDDAARAGFRVRRDPALIVETSSRRDGRVADGLAGTLRALDFGDLPRVAHPEGVAWQARAQALARALFATIDAVDSRRRLGAAIGLSADHVLGVARDCPNAEAFAMRIVPAPPVHPESIPLPAAEAALAALEAAACGVAA